MRLRKAAAALALGLALSTLPTSPALALGKVSLTLDLNDAAGTQYLAEGTQRALVPETLPEREGHTFLGWNTAPDGSGETLAPGDAVPESRTIYAQWDEREDEEADGIATLSSEGLGADGAAAGEPVPATATDDNGTEWSVVATDATATKPSDVATVTDDDGTVWSIVQNEESSDADPEGAVGHDQLPNTGQAPLGPVVALTGAGFAAASLATRRSKGTGRRATYAATD